MVPVVQSNPASPDKRKQKTLEWKELKLCVTRELGSATPVYGGTFLGGVEDAGKQMYHCARQAGWDTGQRFIQWVMVRHGLSIRLRSNLANKAFT